jgi:hypothetical protein
LGHVVKVTVASLMGRSQSEQDLKIFFHVVWITFGVTAIRIWV